MKKHTRRKNIGKSILRITVFCLLIMGISFGAWKMYGFFANKSVGVPNPEDFLSDGEDIVIIDAGHGDFDVGAIGISGVYEKDLTLEVALKLEKMLKDAGIKTHLTRSGDRTDAPYKDSESRATKKTIDMRYRKDLFVKKKGDLLISIHMNSWTTSEPKGAIVLYDAQFDASKTFAEDLQSRINTALEENGEQISKVAAEDLFLYNDVQIPSILVESGFISNPDEEKLLKTDKHQNKLSSAIKDAIIEYFK